MNNYSNNRGNRNDSRGNGRPRFSSQNQMHDATCGDCGNNCKVPFMPSNGKPVYCSDCFEKRGNGRDNNRSYDRPNSRRDFKPRSNRPSVDYAKQFELINTKLDNILRILDKEE